MNSFNIPLPFIMLARLRVDGVGVDQRTEWTAVDDEPWDESPELGGGEEVYFEHGGGVRADGRVPESVDAEFGDYGGVGGLVGLVWWGG